MYHNITECTINIATHEPQYSSATKREEQLNLRDTHMSFYSAMMYRFPSNNLGFVNIFASLRMVKLCETKFER